MHLIWLLPLTFSGMLMAQAPEAPTPAPRHAARRAALRIEVNEFNKAFAEAMARGSADAVADLYSEDGHLLFFKGATFKDRSSIRAFLSEFFKGTGMKSMTLTSEETHRMGAYILDIGHHEMTTVTEGKEETSKGRYMQVLKKDRDGKLQIFRDCPLPD